jgi:hypothetical protein
MDNLTAKEILSAYRPDGRDARDITFQQALEQCQRDPAMREWLANQCQFDAAVAEAMASVPVPQEGKQRLLQADPDWFKQQDDMPKNSPRGAGSYMNRRWWGWGIAALLLLSLVLWQSGPYSEFGKLEAGRFTMASLVNQAMPLSYMDNEPQAVINWLMARGAPVPDGLPHGLQEAKAIGCRVFQMPDGGQVSLLCMLKNGEVVHFFVFDEAASSLLAYAPKNTWWQENGWHFYAYAEGNRRIAMATQGETDSLYKPI